MSNHDPRDDAWRAQLVMPKPFYNARVRGRQRPDANGWARCHCIFHDDANASMSVNLNHGGWRCHGCGKSGDMIAFEMLRTGKPFAEVKKDLIAEGTSHVPAN